MTRYRIRVKDFWPVTLFPGFPQWVAWRDGDEESGRRGYGRTVQEAIEDLKIQEEYDETDHMPVL